MKALIVKSKGVAEVQEVPIPKLRPNYVKVKTVNVALNPTDWKHIYGIVPVGAKVGCDFSGIVEEVGEAVTTKVKQGDKIAGVSHGSNSSNHEDGAFGEHLVVKDGAFIHVPDSLSMENASTLGIAITTIGQGLYRSLKFPYPSEPTKTPFPVLIYGGSSAMGTTAIQYAKLSGLTVVTTASPRNFELVKSYGADAAFDYNDPECAAKIRDYTKNRLYYVFDTITNDGSFKIGAEALSSEPPSSGLHYSALLRIDKEKFPRQDVDTRYTIAYLALGEKYEKMGSETAADPEEYAFLKKFWATASELFAEGKLKTHPVEARSGGLEAITTGLDDLRNNKVSGKKLVYTI